MSYNIMSKNASFKGDISGTIENQVNDWDNQSISGSKSFAAAITSSADVMLSGSGKVSASFFYGDGSNLAGVGGTAAGLDREVQFNDGGTNFGASSNFKFTSGNELQVLGEISSSLNMSASGFIGSGADLTALDADNVSAGSLSAARLDLDSAGGLENNSNSLQINLSGTTSGLSLDSDGLQIDVATLVADTTFSDAKTIIVQNSTDKPAKMALSVLESGMTIRADNVTSGGKLDNSTLPTNISITSLTASSHVSASTFHGNGAALTGVTATPTPAGSNTQIQFNNEGSLAADADLTFLTGSNTLATTILSASTHVSASEFAGAAGTLIDSDGNFAGNNASFNEITASSVISSSANISGAAFIGDGRELSGVPLGSSNAASVVFINNAGNQTITTNADFKFDGTDVLNNGGGFHGTTISSSANTSIGGNLVIGESVTLSSAELGVLDGVTAGTAAASKAMVLDSDADITGFRQLKSTTSDAANVYLTGSSGELQLTIEGINYKDNTNTRTARILPTGIISASSDLQIGGHITGSGDLVFAGSTSKIHFDPAGSGNANGPFISTTNLTSLMIDGDNILNMQGDTNIRLRVGGGSSATHDMRVDITETHFSSSIDLSASALHFADSPSAVITSGGNTFLDNNGNINTGAITMTDGAGALNFGNNQISGSGNISGSQFYGDGSNLTGVSSANRTMSYFLCNQALGTTMNFMSVTSNGGNTNSTQNQQTKFVAPASGSVERVYFTPTDHGGLGDNGMTITFALFKNTEASSEANAGAPQCHATSSTNTSFTLGGAASNTAYKGMIDFSGRTITVSGSNTFDPGDMLLFGVKTGITVANMGVTIVLKMDESVTYTNFV
jgi:hypothetical protein